jgi:hypothetical protein
MAFIPVDCVERIVDELDIFNPTLFLILGPIHHILPSIKKRICTLKVLKMSGRRLVLGMKIPVYRILGPCKCSIFFRSLGHVCLFEFFLKFLASVVNIIFIHNILSFAISASHLGFVESRTAQLIPLGERGIHRHLAGRGAGNLLGSRTIGSFLVRRRMDSHLFWRRSGNSGLGIRGFRLNERFPLIPYNHNASLEVILKAG